VGSSLWLPPLQHLRDRLDNPPTLQAKVDNYTTPHHTTPHTSTQQLLCVGGVVSMTLVMARELGKYGIRVATVAPGSFDTPMLRILGDEHVQKLAKQTPFPQR